MLQHDRNQNILTLSEQNLKDSFWYLSIKTVVKINIFQGSGKIISGDSSFVYHLVLNAYGIDRNSTYFLPRSPSQKPFDTFLKKTDKPF